MPKNDPKLWTVDGIAAELDETIGEMGIAVNYGFVRIGCAYRPSRETYPIDSLRDVRETTDKVELWATIAVDEAEVRAFLMADAEQCLEPGTRYQIRKKIPEFYGRTHGMAWYRNAAMDKAETWGRVPPKPEFTAEGGYYLLGEYTTPKGDAP